VPSPNPGGDPTILPMPGPAPRGATSREVYRDITGRSFIYFDGPDAALRYMGDQSPRFYLEPPIPDQETPAQAPATATPAGPAPARRPNR